MRLIYFLVQFSSLFCKYICPQFTLIRDPVLINVSANDPERNEFQLVP